jgi:hypothetical protein
METPDLHYARSGDVSIAYRVVGGGRGVHELRSIPGEWRLYAVLDA